jgi:hypothetical protein
MKHHQPTDAEKKAVAELGGYNGFLFDILETQHSCEDYEEEELTQARIKKQKRAIKNAYKGALLIQKALKDFQWG